MSTSDWRGRLLDEMPPDLAEEIDIFEGQMELRRQGKIEDRVFAETRLRRGVYGPGGQDGTGLFTVAPDGSGFARIAADGYAPSWQPQPPSPPPGARPKAKAKKKVKLNGKGRAAIGTIVCGGTACKLKTRSARLEVDKGSCRKVRTRLARKNTVRTTARKIATAAITVPNLLMESVNVESASTIPTTSLRRERRGPG